MVGGLAARCSPCVSTRGVTLEHVAKPPPDGVGGQLAAGTTVAVHAGAYKLAYRPVCSRPRDSMLYGSTGMLHFWSWWCQRGRVGWWSVATAVSSPPICADTIGTESSDQQPKQYQHHGRQHDFVRQRPEAWTRRAKARASAGQGVVVSVHIQRQQWISPKAHAVTLTFVGWDLATRTRDNARRLACNCARWRACRDGQMLRFEALHVVGSVFVATATVQCTSGLG